MLARLTVAGESRRVDRFLRDELGAGFGRRAVAALIAAGAVRVNGRVAAKSTLVAAGDEVTVDARPEASTTLQSLPLSLAIVHCDEQLVAVDKPPGLPSTAGRGGAASVAAGLLHRFPEMAAIDSTRAAGLVHRLDTGTSGLLLAARTPLAYRHLRNAFSAKTIVKEYLAVVHGRLVGEGAVSAPLARRPHSSKRMVVADDARGWHAATEYRPLATARDFTLVHLRMRTGVTHQLRVHMAHLGHPVVGDRRYGGTSRADVVGGAVSPQTGDAAWHYLHALRIGADDSELPPGIATAFPAHWQALFARLAWPTALPQPW